MSDAKTFFQLRGMITTHAPCPYGSEKKYKKCCLPQDQQRSTAERRSIARKLKDETDDLFEDLPAAPAEIVDAALERARPVLADSEYQLGPRMSFPDGVIAASEACSVERQQTTHNGHSRRNPERPQCGVNGLSLSHRSVPGLDQEHTSLMTHQARWFKVFFDAWVGNIQKPDNTLMWDVIWLESLGVSG